MLEAAWPLHHVQQKLGHEDAKQTATYLNATRVGLQESMKRFGTRPTWQSVANEPKAENPSHGHDTDTTAPQQTIS